MTSFSYQTLSVERVEAWRQLMLEGAQQYPLGFLLTVEEVSAMGLERCQGILRQRGIRGVFSGDDLIGFCGFRPQRLIRTGHRAELGPFFVTSDHHGTGAANTLMLGAITEAKESGVTQIELFVDTENTRAIAFYERHGFERIATFDDRVRINGKSRQEHFMKLFL